MIEKFCRPIVGRGGRKGRQTGQVLPVRPIRVADLSGEDDDEDEHEHGLGASGKSVEQVDGGADCKRVRVGGAALICTQAGSGV